MSFYRCFLAKPGKYKVRVTQQWVPQIYLRFLPLDGNLKFSTFHLLLKVSLLILFRTLWPLGLSLEFFSRYEEWCQRSVKTKNEQKRSNVTYSTLPICLSVCSLCNVNKESKQRYAHKINHCQYHYLFPYIANPRYCYPDKCLFYFYMNEYLIKAVLV